ncbi:MAG TPA: MerR family transcriptional regulator [Roseiarcus sp.]|nr:MerR family transcriptional regulator [Roseiarcus sp.]
MDKSPDAFRTISEVAEGLDLPQHVLRFWESRFPQIKPLKRGGGRRYYRPDDVELLRAIKQLLYGEGYTIKGVQRLFKEQGPRAYVAKPPADELAGQGLRVDAGRPEGQDDAPLQAGEAGVSAAESEALHAALIDLAEASRILTQGRAG